MKTLVAGFWERTLHFTEKIILLLTIFYFVNWGVSVVLILDAIHTTGNFSYLDTLIMETSTTFRDIVGIAIIKFAVENVFKYNSFGGRVCSKQSSNEDGEFVVLEEQEMPDCPDGMDTYAESEG